MIVVKVGGSLFDWPELPGRLAELLGELRAEQPLLIAGGGSAVAVLRHLDRVHGLGEERSHWLAVRLLDWTAEWLAAIVPGLVPIADLGRCAVVLQRGLVPVLAPSQFLRADEASPEAVRPSWESTSDSIAARVAVAVRATELLLLKSASIPEGADRLAAVRLGLVDPAFPAASRRLPRVAYRNLRDPQARPVPLPGPPGLPDR